MSLLLEWEEEEYLKETFTVHDADGNGNYRGSKAILTCQNNFKNTSRYFEGISLLFSFAV